LEDAFAKWNGTWTVAWEQGCQWFIRGEDHPTLDYVQLYYTAGEWRGSVSVLMVIGENNWFPLKIWNNSTADTCDPTEDSFAEFSCYSVLDEYGCDGSAGATYVVSLT